MAIANYEVNWYQYFSAYKYIFVYHASTFQANRRMVEYSLDITKFRNHWSQ